MMENLQNFDCTGWIYSLKIIFSGIMMVVTDLLIQDKLLWEVADTRVKCKNNIKKTNYLS